MASCGIAVTISLAVMDESVSYGRKFVAVTVMVLAVAALADWPQCGYGRMTKKAMRSYTSVRINLGEPSRGLAPSGFPLW